MVWQLAALSGVATLAGIGANKAANKAERKAAENRAKALLKKADQTIQQGKDQAQSIIGQGQMDQTSFAARQLTTGAMDRATLAGEGSLDEIATRAKNEAAVAILNSQLDAENIRADVSNIYEDIKNRRKAEKWQTASSILGGGLDIYKASR